MSASDTQTLVDALVADSQKHQEKRPVDPADPIYQAELHASLLASDVESYCVQLRRIAHLYAERGQWGNALAVTRKCVQLGHPVPLADLTVISFQNARKVEASAFMDEALRSLSQATGREREEMKRECAIALHHLGRHTEADALTTELQQQDRYEVIIHSIPLRHAALRDPEVEISELKRQQASPSESARVAIALAREHLSSQQGKPAAEKLLTFAGEQASNKLRPDAQPQLIEIARLARKHGLREIEQRAEGVFLKMSRAHAAEADWKPMHLALSAEWFAEKGETVQAEAIAAEAEAAVGKVFVLEAPAALLKLAALHHRLGHAVESTALVVKAARAGLSYPHPRARGLAATEVCLFFANAKATIPDEVTRLLTAIREAHQD